MEVTNAMSTVYTTLDYEYKHKNKAIGQVLVSRKCGMYKWCQKIQDNTYRTNLYGVHTKCSSSHTQEITNNMSTVYTTLD